jgi:hypothetical protein
VDDNVPDNCDDAEWGVGYKHKYHYQHHYSLVVDDNVPDNYDDAEWCVGYTTLLSLSVPLFFSYILLFFAVDDNVPDNCDDAEWSVGYEHRYHYQPHSSLVVDENVYLTIVIMLSGAMNTDITISPTVL